MPQTRQHIQRSYSQQRQRHSQTADAGVRLTRDGIERNVALLVERAQDRLLEEEQLTVGWEK